MKFIIPFAAVLGLFLITGCEEEHHHGHRGGYYGGAYGGYPEYPGYGHGEYRGYPNYPNYRGDGDAWERWERHH